MSNQSPEKVPFNLRQDTSCLDAVDDLTPDINEWKALMWTEGLPQGYAMDCLRWNTVQQYNILLNSLLAVMPCIAPSRSLVLALALTWHSGDPFQPVKSLKVEGENKVVPVAEEEQSTCWGLAGGEAGRKGGGTEGCTRSAWALCNSPP